MGLDFQDTLASPTSAYEEGLRFFRGQGMANDTLHRLVTDLNTYGIDYSVIEAVALNQHGYRRFTEDIDLLMTPEGLQRFQTELVGRGYRPAGEYPGDGRPKPVQFHPPSEHFVVIDGVKTVNLAKLIELKLASGMSGLARLKDLADVQELIRVKSLDGSMAERLDPTVRGKYRELCNEVVQARALEPPAG